ncbi:MAG: DUF2442 domain-containing protein [Bacteroidota bacterium]
MVISIDKASYLKDYQIRFEFSDGKKQTIDFKKFLSEAKNPMTRKYLNKSAFRKFRIEYGDIIWGDYLMCFPIWSIYEGRI